MTFYQNEKTGQVLHGTPQLAARRRNPLKEISDAEAMRLVNKTSDVAVVGTPVAVPLYASPFDAAKAAIEAITDKDVLEGYGIDNFDVNLDKRKNLANMKRDLVDAIADTFGV